MKKVILLFLVIFALISCSSETNCLTKDDLPKRECLTKSELPETVTCDLAKNCLTQNELAQIVSCKEKLADPTKNELAADRAFEEGTKLLSAGKFDEAKIYFVNAINHDPNEINYYKKLFETMKKMKLESEDLAELKTIFELGIYRVDSGYIKELKENILPEIERQINEKNIASEKAESAAESSETVDIKKELSDLEKGELSFARLLKKLDKEKIEERLTQLAAMKENAESNEVDAADEKTKILLQYAIIIETVDQYLETSETLLNKNDEKFFTSIESILQNAKVTLSQAWAIDFDKLKDGKSDPLTELNKYAQKIDDKIKLFGKKKSEPSMNKFNELKAAFDESGNTETEKLKKYEEHLKKIDEIARNIYDKESLDKVMKYVDDLKQEMNQVAKNRVKKYQKWAVSQVEYALELYKNNKVSTDTDAENGCEELKTVDVSLLIPEVSSLYSDVLIQLGNELPWKKKSNCLSSIALSPKKSLENF